jgi:hypothetical protein
VKTNVPKPVVDMSTVTVPKSIAEWHDTLWEKGIYTKSMVTQFFKCPIQTERRHVYGEKFPPGFVVMMGSTYARLMEEWGKRHLEGKFLEEGEVPELVHDYWKERMSNVDEPEAKDAVLAVEKKGRIIQCFAAWEVLYGEVRDELGLLTGAEEKIGYDGSIVVEDQHGTKVKLAGTLDKVFEDGNADDKFVGMKSRYRRFGPWDYEMAHAALVTGKEKSFLFPAIHDFKNKVEVEKKDCTQTPATLKVAIDKVGAFKRSIDAGIFTPPSCNPGVFPCMPKFCGYFGRTCPLTKHLNRDADEFKPVADRKK